jgi:hypothetical protein
MRKRGLEVKAHAFYLQLIQYIGIVEFLTEPLLSPTYLREQGNPQAGLNLSIKLPVFS